MKKLLVVPFVLLAFTTAFAQKDSVTLHQKPPKKDWSKVVLGDRAADHFMIQFGYDNWAATPDSIRTKGFSRSFNMYFMFDFPFKTDPRFSIGAGLGIGSSNIFFDKQAVLVAALNPTLAFPDQTGTNHFKKYKLVTTYFEAPLELRFAFDPEHYNSSWKIAVGAKVGALLSSYNKGKTKQNNADQTINDYIEKESSKRYFNGTRLVATARVSYGVFGIFGQFQVSSLIKNGYGPPVLPFSAGIMLSGL